MTSVEFANKQFKSSTAELYIPLDRSSFQSTSHSSHQVSAVSSHSSLLVSPSGDKSEGAALSTSLLSDMSRRQEPIAIMIKILRAPRLSERANIPAPNSRHMRKRLPLYLIVRSGFFLCLHVCCSLLRKHPHEARFPPLHWSGFICSSGILSSTRALSYRVISCL